MSTARKDTRGELLDACWRLLDEGRAGPIRLEDIAAAAKVSRQAFYLHFANKSELLLALVERAKAEHGFDSDMAAVMRAPTVDEALTLWLSLHVEFTPRIMRVARAIAFEQENDEELRAAWAARRDNRHAHARRLADRARTEGRLAAGVSAAEATDLLWALTAPAFTEDLLVRRRWSKDRLFTHLTSLVRAAILAPASKTTTPKRKGNRR